ncbi:MAG TPA: MlaD family protein [Thermoleophilaceae bacterium]
MRLAIRKYWGSFLTLIGLIVVACAIGVYILNKQGLRLPWEATPFTMKAELSEAEGVKPGQHQAVRIAFVSVGQITKTELQNGHAVLTLEIQPKYRNTIRRDATALLRPKTGLEDMFLDIDPGTASSPPVKSGFTIPVSNTLPPVQSEEILNTLDADARAYLQLLVNGGGEGLQGRGDDLREVFKRLLPLHRDLAKVSGVVARQDRKVRRLIHNYGELTSELAKGDRDLTTVVGASNQVFSAFAQHEGDVRRWVAELPGALRQTESTLGKVNTFATELPPALDALTPALQALERANPSVTRLAKEGTPIVRNQIRPFAIRLQPWLTNLRPAATSLSAATPDLTQATRELNRFFNMAAFNPGGAQRANGDPTRNEGYLFWLGWLVHNTNSLFSTSDASGPFRRATFAISCPTIRTVVAFNPAAVQVLGLTGLLSNECATGAGG